MNINLTQLVQFFAKFGYTIRHNDRHSLFAYRESKTAFGIREVTISFFRAAKQLSSVYDSEGRNVLASVDPFIAERGELDYYFTEFDQRIKDTYAVRLLVALA